MEGSPQTPEGVPTGPPLYHLLNLFFLAYWKHILLLGVLVYFGGQYVYDEYGYLWQRRKAKVDARTLEERQAAARNKQQAWSEISSAEDAMVREEQLRHKAAEKVRLAHEAEQRNLGKMPGDGSKLGTDESPAQSKPAASAAPQLNKKPTQSTTAAKKKPSLGKGAESDDDDGPKKLPKLPGGDKDTYVPFASSSDGSGSTRYKPADRNCRKKGG